MSDQKDQLRSAFEGMLEYGRSTIRALFLLNAGAIVAMLAFLSSVIEHSDAPGAAAPFVSGLWTFIVGLLFAVAASFSAYWNFMVAFQNPDRLAHGDRVLHTTQLAATACGILSGISFLIGAWLIAQAIAAL